MNAPPVRAYANLQPAVGAGELISEIQRDREHAVGKGNGGVGESAAYLSVARVRGKEGKGKIITADGRAAVAVEPALIGKSRALGKEACVGDTKTGHRRQKDFDYCLCELPV